MTYTRHESYGPVHVLSLNVQKHVGKLYFLFTDEQSEGQYKKSKQNESNNKNRTLPLTAL